MFNRVSAAKEPPSRARIGGPLYESGTRKQAGEQEVRVAAVIPCVYLAKFIVAALVLSGVTLVGQSGASADQIPEGWEASNMRPIGYSGLDGHGAAFKMAIRTRG
jgi:hypothetical protein